MLFSNEKVQTTNIYDNIEESHKYYMERKNPDMKEYVLYDSIYLKFKKSKLIYNDRIVEVSY